MVAAAGDVSFDRLAVAEQEHALGVARLFGHARSRSRGTTAPRRDGFHGRSVPGWEISRARRVGNWPPRVKSERAAGKRPGEAVYYRHVTRAVAEE